MLMPEEGWRLVSESIPQISSVPMLCEVNPIETLSERRMLEGKPISTFHIGSNHTTKIIQVFQATLVFGLYVWSHKMEMGVLQHNLKLRPGEGQTKEMLKRLGGT